MTCQHCIRFINIQISFCVFCCCCFYTLFQQLTAIQKHPTSNLFSQLGCESVWWFLHVLPCDEFSEETLTGQNDRKCKKKKKISQLIYSLNNRLKSCPPEKNVTRILINVDKCVNVLQIATDDLFHQKKKKVNSLSL